MPDIAFKVESLSKRYPSTVSKATLRASRIGLAEEHHATLAATLTAFLRRLTQFEDGAPASTPILRYHSGQLPMQRGMPRRMKTPP